MPAAFFVEFVGLIENLGSGNCVLARRSAGVWRFRSPKDPLGGYLLSKLIREKSEGKSSDAYCKRTGLEGFAPENSDEKPWTYLVMRIGVHRGFIWALACDVSSHHDV